MHTSATQTQESPIKPWQCGAKTRDGTPCLNPKVKGRKRCRMHGGKTLVGPDSATYKHGRTSIIGLLKPNLRAHADQVIANPNRLDMAEPLALLQANLAEAVSEWSAGGGAGAWIKAGELVEQYRREVRKGDTASIPHMQSLNDELHDLVLTERGAQFARQEVRDTVESIRKVGETERRRRVAERSMVTQEFLIAFASRVLSHSATSIQMVLDGRTGLDARQYLFRSVMAEMESLALASGREEPLIDVDSAVEV